MLQRGIYAVGIVLVLGVVSMMFFGGGFVEWVSASDIAVFQYPRAGLGCVSDRNGYVSQWWADVTRYRKRDQVWFLNPADKARLFKDPMKEAGLDPKTDESIEIQFNEGGKGRVSGSIAWEMPLDCPKVLSLHAKYNSHEAVEQQLVRVVLGKVVYLSGQLMSSTESYASRRADLLSAIDDQIRDGVYRTESRQERQTEKVPGGPSGVQTIEKTVNIVSILRDPKGNYQRQENPPLDDFGIRTFNLAIASIIYEPAVQAQINAQQQAVTRVQTAIAEAKEAEQKAITEEQKGKAEAAVAKWKQEVVKATEVTRAEQAKAVADLDKLTAAAEKAARVLRGEGEAEARRLAMTADNALDRRLQTVEKIHALWSEAFKNFQGDIVSRISTGGVGPGAPGRNAFQDAMEAVSIKAMKDLDASMGQRERKP